ncbi:MAG: hypothetical protein M0Q38_14870 [Bacteroidales bacterium]|jgi:hypothetical protein|nr:hypothetical protein [Bacteroidales bacterium]
MPPPKKTISQTPSSPDLKSLSPEALEGLVSDLYNKFDIVRNFIDFRMTGNSDPLVKKYKKLIKNRLIEDIEEGTNKNNQTKEDREVKYQPLIEYFLAFFAFL